MRAYPFFSICIPNYNYAQYIGQTISSVLEQSYPHFEIIVADNASTDDSVATVRSFHDDRIRLTQNQYNIGFAPNLDKATEPATGDYLILLSSDDLMKPDALAEYAAIIRRHPERELVIMSACSVIDSAGKVTGRKLAKTGDVVQHLSRHQILPVSGSDDGVVESYQAKDVLRGLLTRSFQPAGQFLTTCYARSLYTSVEGYRSIMSVYPDAHFSHKILFRDPAVLYVNKELFSYRVHDLNNYSASVGMANVKHLTDSYLFTKIYGARELEACGLRPADLEQAFVENQCLRSALWALLRGSVANAVRLMAFGTVTYPARLYSDVRLYLLVLLIPVSPLMGLAWLLGRTLKYRSSVAER